MNIRRNDNVVITLKRCHSDVITSKWHRFVVIATSLLRNESAGTGLYFLWMNNDIFMCNKNGRITSHYWTKSTILMTPLSLHWRHNDHDSVSNHQPRGCLLNHLFGCRSKKTSKLCVTGLCAGNSPGPVNSPHKGPETRKMFPFDNVIMIVLQVSTADCFEIVETCRRHGVILAVCHVLRYMPQARCVEQLIRNGEIGDVVNIQLLEPVSGNKLYRYKVRSS